VAARQRKINPVNSKNPHLLARGAMNGNVPIEASGLDHALLHLVNWRCYRFARWRLAARTATLSLYKRSASLFQNVGDLAG
jgi:hypothetical protein